VVVRRQLEQLRAELVLPADATAPSRARQEIRALLRDWRLLSTLDPVLLAVSELVTNAVRYGRPPVRLTARTDGSCLGIGVHDAGGPLVRAPGEPGLEDESGRGLAILAALGERTGTRQEEHGKVVWVQFGLDQGEVDSATDLP
jgi:anti-sigma regulatory factor (Ser/Thr protein kinase)